jgi:hypothetical protein
MTGTEIWTAAILIALPPNAAICRSFVVDCFCGSFFAAKTSDGKAVSMMAWLHGDALNLLRSTLPSVRG